MKILLDFTHVSSCIRAFVLKLLEILSYSFQQVLGSQQATVQVPRLYDFIVYEDDTVDTAVVGFNVSVKCEKKLTEANFGGDKKVGILRGGSIKMDHAWEAEEGDEAVRLLAEKTGRKFRPGTALEFLLFKRSRIDKIPYHGDCIALGSVWNGDVLYWIDWSGPSTFDLHSRTNRFSAEFEVFFVEDDPQNLDYVLDL